MSAMSDYLENKLVDHLFRGAAKAYTAPTSLFVALYTAAPSDSGGGTECTGTGYARVEVVSGYSTWKSTNGLATDTVSSGTGGQTSNAGTITFPTPGAGGWGNVTHWGIFDHATNSTNLIAHGALTTPKSINYGDPAPTLAAGAVVLTFA